VKVPAGLIRSSLSDSAKLLFVAMGMYGWESSGSPCTASQARLAADLGWSVRTVQRAARELEAAGYLTCVPEPGKPNRYSLAYGKVAAPTPDTHVRPPLTPVSDLPLTPVSYEADERESDEKSRGTAATSALKVKASGDDKRAAGFLDWHSKLIEAKTGEPPQRGDSSLAAARLIVARADGDRIRSVVEWALSDRFYADKVTTATGVERWWSRICLSHDAAVGTSAPVSDWTSTSYDSDRVQVLHEREKAAA
jgi:hypothetical protein